MSEVSPELVERMVALVRAMRPKLNDDGTVVLIGLQATYLEAAALYAMLPKPVDPDLIEARKVAVANLTFEDQSKVFLDRIGAGDCDDYAEVRIALAAIKRGRELASQVPA